MASITAERVMAAMGLLVCAGLLLHMVMGPARQQQLQAAAQRLWMHWRARWRGGAQATRTPAANEKMQQRAADEARSAIERARRGKVDAEREGNVIRPRAFKDKPDAPDRLH
jgi:hypothetical protein